MIVTDGTKPEDVTPVRMAVALILGGIYAAATVALGLYALAAGSYPLAFGIRLGGEQGAYPFPFPDLVLSGGIITAVGVGLALVLVLAAKGGSVAHYLAITGLGAAIIVCGIVARASSDERRCAYESFYKTQRCTSRSVATMRDFTLLALPAGVAIACLATRRPRPAEGDQYAGSQPEPPA